ncbi:MAG: hypothetical protein WC840_03880 [Candidatus Peribacteraceae bacterium]
MSVPDLGEFQERPGSGVSVLSRMSAIRSAGGGILVGVEARGCQANKLQASEDQASNIYNCIFLRLFSETEDFEERFSE